jgi:hypothetical protein
MSKAVRGKSKVERRKSKLVSRKSESDKSKQKEELHITVTPARIVAPDQRSTLSAPVSGPSAMFELFPYLAAELRSTIWEMAEPAPRRVDVLFKKHPRYMIHKFKADIPTLLHVCRESRYEMKKTYEVVFKHDKALNQCYFNFERDTLFLPWTPDLQQKWWNFATKSKSPNGIQKVQKLALDAAAFDCAATTLTCKKFTTFRFSFKGLKQIIMMLEGKTKYCSDSCDEGFCSRGLVAIILLLLTLRP